MDGWNTGADTGFPEGVGVKTFTSTPPPLDIVRVTSSALRKIEKHPHPWTFTSTHPPLDIVRVTSSALKKLKNTPPLGHCPCDVSHIPRGGGDRSRSRTLCIGFEYRDKFKGGGGGDHPCHLPLDPPLEHYIQGMVGLSIYHGRNKESSSNRRGWLIRHSGAYFHL